LPDLLARNQGPSFGPEAAENARSDVRTAALQFLGGLVLAIGALFTALTLQQTRERDEVQRRHNEERIRIDREGQITERFTRAIDQLGSNELDVRLGGIYALERIARDSPEDHGPIMEVLTAYVREHAPWPPHISNVEGNASSGAGADRLLGDRAGPMDERSGAPKIATDVQAVMTVIGRRHRQHEKDSEAGLDLRYVDLRGAVLEGAHLERAYLAGTHLEHAHLAGAHLEHAVLVGAHLERAYLEGAHLEHANLLGAHLDRANLGGAHLEHAKLLRAYMERAFLLGAHLEDANLGGAHLEHANLLGAHLDRANLGGAHLEHANLAGAHVEHAKLDADERGQHRSGPPAE
jgi:uncharacterized protein YjbI with pentapeptide repeats